MRAAELVPVTFLPNSHVHRTLTRVLNRGRIPLKPRLSEYYFLLAGSFPTNEYVMVEALSRNLDFCITDATTEGYGSSIYPFKGPSRPVKVNCQTRPIVKFFSHQIQLRPCIYHKDYVFPCEFTLETSSNHRK